MSNKSTGRAMAELNPLTYVRAMGGTVEDRKNILNTGVDFTNYAVFKYFRILRNYALNRIQWTSNVLEQYELRLIEWNIFHYGYCAMVKPRITKNGVTIRFPLPRVYQCSFIDINNRTGRPEKISIVNQQSKHFIIDILYNRDEFTIFTDEFIYSESPHPFGLVAWEYANELHEIDLAFSMNTRRLRMPFAFNDRSISKENALARASDGTVTVAELVRSAMGRNEPYLSVPDNMIGDTGNFMWEPQHTENYTQDFVEAKKKIIQAYLELLGLYTSNDRSGVYTVKRLQENGNEAPDFITDTLNIPRVQCAKQAALMFGIDLDIEVI